MSKPIAAMVPYYLFAGVALVQLARGLRKRRGDGPVLYAAGIAAFYAVVLMQVVHYPIYEYWGLSWLSVQARYLFPVLIPIYGVVVWALMESLGSTTRWVLFAGVTPLFVAGDLPYFVFNSTPQWFIGR